MCPVAYCTYGIPVGTICVYTCSHITLHVLVQVHVVSLLCVGVYIMCASVYAHECLVIL